MNLGTLIAGRVRFDDDGRLVVVNDGELQQSPLLPGAAFVQNAAGPGGPAYDPQRSPSGSQTPGNPSGGDWPMSWPPAGAVQPGGDPMGFSSPGQLLPGPGPAGERPSTGVPVPQSTWPAGQANPEPGTGPTSGWGSLDPITDYLFQLGFSVTPERLASHGSIAPLEPFVNPYENIHIEGPNNQYNVAIVNNAIAAQKAIRPKGTSWGAGGFGQANASAGSPPWEVMPPNGRPFHYQQAVSCPALGTNDFAVLSFLVPTGWNAAIKAIANIYTSAGFVEGSSDLIWRIDVDGVYLPGFDNITTTLGSTDQSRRLEGAILAKSNELVRYTISVAAAASIPVGTGNNIICSIDGWFYPES